MNPILYSVILYLRGNTLAIAMREVTQAMTLYVNGWNIGMTRKSKRMMIQHVKENKVQLLAHFEQHYGRRIRHIVVE